MGWRAANSLLVLHAQLKHGAPRAAPPAADPSEWGLIGDAAHDPSSDHTPHNFPGWGNQIVTAADFPNRPDLGLDAHRVLDDIRRSKDARVKYGISNGQMFSSYAVSGFDPWTWRPYNPKNGDKHFTHGHLSVVGDSRADGTQPWATIGAPAAAAAAAPEEDDDMIRIEIADEGFTSIPLPPVQGGAWPREVYLNICNDTGGLPYLLRAWYSTGGAEQWAPLPNWGDKAGIRTLRSGEQASVGLPKGTTCVTLSRQAPAGGVSYGGALFAAVERGPIIAGK